MTLFASESYYNAPQLEIFYLYELSQAAWQIQVNK